MPRAGDWNGGAPTPGAVAARRQRGRIAARRCAVEARRIARLRSSLSTRVLVRRCALRIETLGAELEVALDRGVVRGGRPIAAAVRARGRAEAGRRRAVDRGRPRQHRRPRDVAEHDHEGDARRSLAEPSGAPSAVKAKPAQIDPGADGPRSFARCCAAASTRCSPTRACLPMASSTTKSCTSCASASGACAPPRASSARGAARSATAGWRPPPRCSARSATGAIGAPSRRRAATARRGGLARPGASARAAPGDAIDPVAIVRGQAFQHALLDLLAFLLESPASPLPVVGADDDAADADDPRSSSARHLDRCTTASSRREEFEQLDVKRATAPASG